jgi:hypothetical protein
MTEPDTSAGAAPAPNSKAFAGVATLLIGAILMCGVFAGLAGQKIGNKHVDFIISFTFLGIVVILIFGLAWVDANTRGPDQGQRYH